ncbi:MAG: hypothetical protein V1754_08445 [Pseudomonadota bacterium]
MQLTFKKTNAAQLIGITAFILCVLFGYEAGAERIALLNFSGPHGAKTANQIRRSLRTRFEIVGADSFMRTASNQGFSWKTTRGKIASAEELGISGIVQGSVQRALGRWLLNVSVLSGHNARKVGGVTVRLRGTRLDRSGIRRVVASISSLLRRTSPPRSRTRNIPSQSTPKTRDINSVVIVDPDSELPAQNQRQARQPTADPSTFQQRDSEPVKGVDAIPEKNAPDSNVTDEDLGFDVMQTPQQTDRAVAPNPQDDESPPSSSEKKKNGNSTGNRPSWEYIFEGDVGLVLFNRSFDFNPKDPVRFYRSPPVAPAIFADGAIFPFAAFTRGFFADVGVVGRYLRSLGLTAQMEGSSQPANTIVQLFEVGLRYRWNILDKGSSPSLRIGAEFGRMGFFIVDDAIRLQLPNVNYTYLKPTIGFDLPFYYTPDFSFGGTLHFDYLVVFSAGDIERTDEFGYGNSNTGGIDAGLGFYAGYKGFFLKLSGFYRRFFFDFDSI